MTRAAVVALAGSTLDAAEAALLRRLPPAGVILFGRNVRDPQQLAALVASLRAVLPAEAVLLVDQEGGRVARLRPPHWRAHPPAGALGRLPSVEGERAAWLTGALIGLDCAAAGFDVACAPVLDLALPEGHAGVVGDRAFGADAESVARLGRAMADGLLAAGVQPVGKHVPGHGRATADSHAALPEVHGISGAELHPFERCADLPWMMTAHVRFPTWDSERPATLSPGVLRRIVRGRIGFNGVLVSDDLAMGALSAFGDAAARATLALSAGCDLALHCSGVLAETEAVLAAAPELPDATRARLAAARDMAARARQPLDAPDLAAERDALLATSDDGAGDPTMGSA